MDKTVDIRPLQRGDVPQIVPLLAENYKTQAFRVAFFKHVMRQPAPALGLALFGAISFFSWGSWILAVLSPILLYVYLAALYHFRVSNRDESFAGLYHLALLSQRQFHPALPR